MRVDRRPWFEYFEKGRPKPTDAECVQSCLANAEQAAAEEKDARLWYGRTQQGTEACQKAWEAIIRHSSDQRHWREYADWYRKRVARAAAQVPAVLPPPALSIARPPAATAAPMRPTRERQPGEDDDDERVSAWEDLGAAVQR